jgi:hypothetical protein
MTSANQTTITCRIDSQNIIVGVDGAWEAFARDNGAVGLPAATVWVIVSLITSPMPG